MARNSAGTYSLPASTSPGTNPVVPGTSIGSTWANSTLGDVATELSDSLSRSGKGGMTAPLRTADGAVGAPAHSFTSETGSGWFRHAAGEMRLAILGVYRIAVTAVGIVVNGTFNAIGAATFGSTVVASGTIEATGALKSKDTGGTGKIVSVSAPVGLAADYGMTFPGALPASTLPVTLSAAGALATGQITNAQQNFGTPSAATNVVILSYLDRTSDTPTAGTNVSLAMSVYKRLSTVEINGYATFGAATFSAGATFLTLGVGYRPTYQTITLCHFFEAGSATWGIAQVSISTTGLVSFLAINDTTAWSGGSLLPTASGDAVYMNISFPVA